MFADLQTRTILHAFIQLVGLVTLTCGFVPSAYKSYAIEVRAMRACRVPHMARTPQRHSRRTRRLIGMSVEPDDAARKQSTTGGFDPVGEFREMLRNLDAVVDDFVNKRMGNGEVSHACYKRMWSCWCYAHAFMYIHETNTQSDATILHTDLLWQARL